MLETAKKFYDLGFAIHWIKPNSKRPVEPGWTKGDRHTWEHLKQTYVEGMNVGVRLGEASKIGEGYLAVIDVDVKSDKPKHMKEAHDYVSDLLKRIGANEIHSRVRTGRGNGSMHIYGTTRTPLPSSIGRLCQSSESVRLRMPSAGKPSKHELATLNADQIRQGIRIRPAWEIQVMSQGRQVVMPPSRHCDTGTIYAWTEDIKPIDLVFPMFDFSSFESEETKKVSVDKKDLKFTPEEVDLVGSNLPDFAVDLIILGAGIEKFEDDKSRALMSAISSMVKHRFSDNEILSVLTDQKNFLGQVAFEHRKTESRANAADWLLQYGVTKARKQIEAKYQFDSEVEIETLSEEEAEIQQIELLEPEDWRTTIERTGNAGDERPKQTVKNVVIILRGELGEGIFTKNEFSGSQFHTRSTPWGGRKDQEINDEHLVRIQHWLSRKYRFEPSVDKINSAIAVIAAENAFHPVRDYLEPLEWDGVPRVDSWLKTYCGAKAPEPYLSAISRKTLVAMIARIYNPGVKFDQVLILEGEQGIRKSTTIRVLAGEWFSDVHINVSDKDGVLSMRGVWIVELGELSGMRKADADAYKEFISRTHDRIRVPYGRRTESFARQCIFIGTTNNKEYLKDPTGNRRFWPVEVGECDTEALKRDRDQLLAEAKFIYDNLDEPLYIEDPIAQKQALIEQSGRMIHDTWTDKITEFFARVERGDELNFKVEQFTMSELFSGSGPLGGWKENMIELKRAADALRKLGYYSKLARGPKGRGKYWFKKNDESVNPCSTVVNPNG